MSPIALTVGGSRDTSPSGAEPFLGAEAALEENTLRSDPSDASSPQTQPEKLATSLILFYLAQFHHREDPISLC